MPTGCLVLGQRAFTHNWTAINYCVAVVNQKRHHAHHAHTVQATATATSERLGGARVIDFRYADAPRPVAWGRFKAINKLFLLLLLLLFPGTTTHHLCQASTTHLQSCRIKRIRLKFIPNKVLPCHEWF